MQKNFRHSIVLKMNHKLPDEFTHFEMVPNEKYNISISLIFVIFVIYCIFNDICPYFSIGLHWLHFIKQNTVDTIQKATFNTFLNI